jgi:hypothetical protein
MHGRADLEGRTFLCLVVAVSIAFAWILWPFYGAILWAAVVAIVFTPLYRRASHLAGTPCLADARGRCRCVRPSVCASSRSAPVPVRRTP